MPSDSGLSAASMMEAVPAPAVHEPLLELKDLKLHLGSHGGVVRALDGVDLAIARERTLCIVGESGCGKSMTARSIMRLVGPPGILTGSIMFQRSPSGEIVDLAALPQHGRTMRAIRGREIAMIFQEPMTSLSPVHTIGDQIIEAIRQHEHIGKAQARECAAQLLERVGIPRPRERLDTYTFQLSGGMRQRAMIAMALSCSPNLLIADEPTTALDVTTQAQILELMRELRAGSGMSVLFITHDLGIVAEMADEVAVMYLGRVVEQGPVEAIFGDPQHPYTKALLRSMPTFNHVRGQRLTTIRGMVPDPLARPPGCPFNNRCDSAVPEICERALPPSVDLGNRHRVACFLAPDTAPAREPMTDTTAAAANTAIPTQSDTRRVSADPLLTIQELKVHFPIRRGFLRRKTGAVKAVDGINLTIHRGETLGLVGESGCGKTTVGRSVVRALMPSSGRLLYDRPGEEQVDLVALNGKALRQVHRGIRLVFQDPYSSLDPRLPVVDIVGESLEVHGIARGRALENRVAALLRLVGLRPEYMRRHAHAFSGGERQRISIARALALDPQLIVCDEAVSALDVSVQAQILNLLQDLQGKLGLTLLFISHDLGVVRHICDRVAVMYLGKIVELARPEDLFSRPRHPYTEALLSAVPQPMLRSRSRSQRVVLKGETPDPANPPGGCPFHTRCAYSDGQRCTTEAPQTLDVAPGHTAACHHAERLMLRGLVVPPAAASQTTTR